MSKASVMGAHFRYAYNARREIRIMEAVPAARPE